MSTTTAADTGDLAVVNAARQSVLGVTHSIDTYTGLVFGLAHILLEVVPNLDSIVQVCVNAALYVSLCTTHESLIRNLEEHVDVIPIPNEIGVCINSGLCTGRGTISLQRDIHRQICAACHICRILDTVNRDSTGSHLTDGTIRSNKNSTEGAIINNIIGRRIKSAINHPTGKHLSIRTWCGRRTNPSTFANL